jgi:hypothetical protein
MSNWIALTILTALAAQAETLDRIAVTVGTQVVTESQMMLALRGTALLSRVPVDLSGPSKRKMAQWLADQIMILQEAAANHITLPSSEAAKGKLESVKALYPAAEQYERDLERYSIQERDLAELLLADLREQTFVDLRFRPEIQVSDDDLKAYYAMVVAGRSGAVPTYEACKADESCRADLEKKLTDQRATDALDKWLITARAAARVQYRDKAFE